MTLTQPKPQTVPVNKVLSDYAKLSKQVRDANLLEKDIKFYIKKFIQVSALSLLAWGGVVLLHGSPLALIIAPILGILGAQYGFLAHEAGHKQVFKTNKVNDWSALITANLLVGLSFGWWNKRKHNYHHANPNTVDKDPDINIHVLTFTKEDYDSRKGFEKVLTKRQGYLFPILLLFTGFDLLFESVKTLTATKNRLDRSLLELGLIVLRFAIPGFILFSLFNPFVAGGFMLIQMMIFGLFMGGAFAPNHKGMPIIPKDMKVDFLRRQVLTSRNIKGGVIVDNLMGGLNYQIEHHLFPSMPRPNLKKAQKMIEEFCQEHNISYLRTNLFESYGIVIRHLNEVGIKGADPFECPMVAQYRS